MSGQKVTAGRTKPAMQLDVQRLLRHFGGAAALRKKLDILGTDEKTPTAVQMRKWVERKKIPGDWLVVLLVQAKLERRPIDITDFVMQ